MPLYRLNGSVVFFVHIPKTGGTSIEQALRELGCAEALYFPQTHPSCQVSWQHLDADIYEKAIGASFYDYAFAVVRNPYTRIASEYRMKVADKGGRRTFDDWFARLMDRYAASPYVRDNHMRPQRDFLSPGVETFRFEDGLENPLLAACKALDVEPPRAIPHARKGSDTVVECSAETLAAVAAHYGEDFATLGYSLDDYAGALHVRT